MLVKSTGNNKKRIIDLLKMQYLLNKYKNPTINIIKNIDNISNDFFIVQGNKYYNDENFERALHYYSYAKQRGSLFAIKRLANTFDNLEDYNNAEEYYIRYINKLTKFFKNPSELLDVIVSSYEELFNTYLKRKSIKAYNFYISKKNIFDKFNKNIRYTFNKLLPKFRDIASFMTKYDDCSICYTSKRLHVYYCGTHYFCDECYMKINSCALCRFKLDDNNDENDTENETEESDDENDILVNELLWYIVRNHLDFDELVNMHRND